MTNDGSVSWLAGQQRWELMWLWKDPPPSHLIGSGLGEYSRTSLTPEQETMFADEVDSWIKNGWLHKYDHDELGMLMCVLPLIA